MKTLLAILSLALISAPAYAQVVPEPGTLALFAVAGVGALLLKLKK